MYNVGFGDCFLLAFPAADRTRKVLIDCGSHSAGRGPQPIADVARRVVTDVTEEDGTPRIDVVVATHRHQDHVSGFREEIWNEVEVSEIWMPWTEHPTDPEAKRIRETQSSVARHLCLALEATQHDAAAGQLAQNSLTNAAAMQTLHEGFSGTPARRFLPCAERDRNSFEVDALPGVTVHAMGPSRDPIVIRDMDPPVGGGYLRMAESGSSTDAEPTPLFNVEWAIDPTVFLSTDDFEHLRLKESELDDFDQLNTIDYFQVAVALEKAVNGTSLMLMFVVDKAFLLFPGDAQWGTWQTALADQRWRELLAQTVFYKVGHHGSHNATPRAFVEELLWSRRAEPDTPLDDFSAAVSTRAIDIWKYIPKKELLKALHSTTPRLARSDVRDPHAPGFDYIDDIVLETRIATTRTRTDAPD
jgi:beta-lactamase superfamily II metal-dependent hydrolase